MRIALTAGGTGGHIFPAFSVLDALEAALGADLEVAFFGPENRGERAIVEARGLRFVSIPAAAVRGRGPARLVKSGWQLSSGLATALRRLRSFRPDAVFSTGGYASFPASLAARILRKPLVVFLPDVSPGWAVRAEQRLATRMATTTDAALKYLPAAKTVVTGYPVRAASSVAGTRRRPGTPWNPPGCEGPARSGRFAGFERDKPGHLWRSSVPVGRLVGASRHRCERHRIRALSPVGVRRRTGAAVRPCRLPRRSPGGDEGSRPGSDARGRERARGTPGRATARVARTGHVCGGSSARQRRLARRTRCGARDRRSESRNTPRRGTTAPAR